MDTGQIGEYQVEFTGRLDQTGNRRATEVGERGSVSVALAGGAKVYPNVKMAPPAAPGPPDAHPRGVDIGAL